MAWRVVKFLLYSGSLSLLLCGSVLYFRHSLACTSTDCNIFFANKSSAQLSKEQLHKISFDISVKIISKDFLGTGIILRKQGSIYTVVTNAHVLRGQKMPLSIQTVDGRIHQASTPQVRNFGTNDLALLYFKSDNPVYEVATLGVQAKIGDEVFAGGFPFEQEGIKAKNFTFNTGKITLILPKPLEGGYQIGYNNNIQKGMSGGPLLNQQGILVGINGMHANPLWEAPSVYADGSEAEEELHQLISKLSWAIPVEQLKI